MPVHLYIISVSLFSVGPFARRPTQYLHIRNVANEIKYLVEFPALLYYANCTSAKRLKHVGWTCNGTPFLATDSGQTTNADHSRLNYSFFAGHQIDRVLFSHFNWMLSIQLSHSAFIGAIVQPINRDWMRRTDLLSWIRDNSKMCERLQLAGGHRFLFNSATWRCRSA